MIRACTPQEFAEKLEIIPEALTSKPYRLRKQNDGNGAFGKLVTVSDRIWLEHVWPSSDDAA